MAHSACQLAGAAGYKVGPSNITFPVPASSSQNEGKLCKCGLYHHQYHC